MIQVDVFWSFAMGASLATLAGSRLKKESSTFVNKYFVYTVCYLSLIFSPSGVYLLWHHTAWETMFFYGPDELHGIFPCLFALTNVLLGIVGFYLCDRLVRSDRDGTAHAVWTTAYTCMFSILSFGYDRFLYAGTLEEWRKGIRFPLTDIFSAQIFYTLLVMGVFVVPPLGYAMITWPAGSATDTDRKYELLRLAVTPYYRVTGVIMTSYLVLLVCGVLPPRWHVDRLFAFLLGQAVFGLFIFLPLFLLRTKTRLGPSRVAKTK